VEQLYFYDTYMKEFTSVIINKCPCTNAFLSDYCDNLIDLKLYNLFNNPSLMILSHNLDTILASYLFYLDERI
jgi:hypothetical protein